jgi:excinuclease ABC subunit C
MHDPQTPFEPEAFLKRLPQKPGVYQMLDGAAAVLYVGKARNLKSRVTSYFRASGLSAKTMALVARIADIQITLTASETEALLLEQSLIKKIRPPYNVVLRDDKSYPYIYLTDHEYPRLAFHRGTKRKTGRYFGPFPSASAVRDSLNILQKLFQLRQCEDSYFKNRSRPCLQHQIGRCTAPCVGLIEPQAYADDVRHAVMFLDGRNDAILDDLKQTMEQAAEQLQFERAAKARDQIAHMRKVQEQQYVHAASGDVDVFAVALGSGSACVQGVFIRGGRLLGHRTWYPRNELAVEGAELLNAFLAQYYFGGGEREIPKTIILSESIADVALLESALNDASGHRVEITSGVRTQRARWLEMAQENARLALDTYLADKTNMLARCIDLQEGLDLEELPRRLECFDISHSSGEATVASCVVFDSNGPLKSDYRRFNIDGIAPGDDYGAMNQALRRRYERLKSGDGELPDLLIIDGGPGQLSQARAVLTDLQIETVQILGIAKGTTRKPGLETIFFGEGEVAIPPHSPAMHLLQHIRDEAHRFAITGHRQRRGKSRRQSELEGIAGIGPKRRRELLRHFGSVAAVRGASREEIAKVPGVSRKLADEIYATLHVE